MDFRRWYLFRTNLMLLAFILIGSFGLWAEESLSPLSVVPFTNNTGHEEWDWLAVGLSDMLTTDLAKAGIAVVNRQDLESVLEEQALVLSGLTENDALVVGSLLSADRVLTGSYVLAGSTLRIDARIVEVETGAVIDSAAASGSAGNILAAEAELAVKLCMVLGVEAPAALIGPGTTSLPAVQSFYEGLTLRMSGSITEAQEKFHAAAKLDPLYAAPRYSLEESWRLLNDFRALRKQRELNTLWKKADALRARLAASPFVSDSEAIMAAYTAGSPTVQIGTAPEDDPTLGSCPDPAVCLWNLQICYWEIASKSRDVFDDGETERAAYREVINLADQAEEEWPNDPWLPEILYWKVMVQRFLGEWEAVKTGCERFFIEWPDFRMAWALEDMYEAALTELDK